MKFSCRLCRLGYEVFRPRCIKCKALNSIRPNPESLVVSSEDETQEFAQEKWVTGDGVFDAAFGGLPKNFAVLIAGLAGIGKSTIVMQACGGLARSGKRGLYIAGEEHVAQVIARAKAVGSVHKNLDIIPGTTEWEDILRVAKGYDFAVYDSIQELRVNAGMCTEPATRILISQLNGEGEIAQGRDNEHKPDVLAFCHKEDDIPIGGGQMVRLGRLDVVKYRLHGLTSVQYALRTTARVRIPGDIEVLREEFGYEEESEEKIE